MTAKRVGRKKITVEKEPPQLDKYWTVAIIVAILLLTFLIYSNTFSNGFIYFDDPDLVIDNYSIREITWGNLGHYFTTPVQFTLLPLGLLSYAIDYQIGKLDPFIYHFNSVMYHLLTVIMVYWLFQVMTKKPAISLLMALLFGIHPVSVDGVAWISIRNNLLATFFFLAALLSYTFYIKKNFKARYLVFACLFFVLSLLSKSSSVVLPFALLLWDYYYDRKWELKLFLEKIPFLLISLVFGILTLNVRADVVSSVQYDYNLFDRFILYCSSLTDYFVRFLFPLQLSMSYAYPLKDGMFLPLALYLSPFILVLIVWGLFKLKISKKTLVIGLLFFLLNITLSQAVLLIDNFMASRYAYLSYVGLFFIVADVNHEILSASDGWKHKLRVVWLIALTIFVTGFSVLTYSRNFVWKDSISLFDDVVAKQPNIPWVYSNRGIAKYKANDFDGALKDFNYSLSLDPNFPLSFYYRGIIEYLRADDKAAMADFDQVVAMIPDFTSAYNERAKVKIAMQDYQGALDDYSEAIARDPYFIDAYFNRGKLKYDMADYQGALDDFSKAIEYYPEYAEAFFMRSIVKRNLNDPSGSCDDQKTAIALGYQPPADQVDASCP